MGPHQVTVHLAGDLFGCWQLCLCLHESRWSHRMPTQATPWAGAGEGLEECAGGDADYPRRQTGSLNPMPASWSLHPGLHTCWRHLESLERPDIRLLGCKWLQWWQGTYLGASWCLMTMWWWWSWCKQVHASLKWFESNWVNVSQKRQQWQ